MSGRKGGKTEGKRDLLALAERLSRSRVGVVGDFVADVYVYGKPARLSREAPVLVATFEGEETVPGSAANTANNLAALGVPVWPVTIVGDDEAGRALKSHFARLGVETDGILLDPGARTIMKTRFCLGDLHRSRHQVLRIDREEDAPLSRIRERRVLAALAAADKNVRAWIVSDYGYSLLSPGVAVAIRRISRRKPVVVDSHDRLGEFPGVAAVTPNHEEALRALDLSAAVPVERLAQRLRKTLRVPTVLLTLGKDGMVLANAAGTCKIPAAGSEEAVDVSGCGDTVAAVFTAAVAAGADALSAAWLANLAASVVVMKPRTATLSRDELASAIRSAV
ncbi:MAG: PfkB family carbohydrate kinase [Planctomycetota bacterium]